MKRFLLFLLALASLGLANEATADILDARADYVACDVDYARDWLEMRDGCGEQEDVETFDWSDHMDDLEDDLDDLRESADDGDRLSFGLAMVKVGADSLKLIGEIVRDAFDHKTLAFFSCVRDGEKPLMDERDDCRADALDKEASAAKDYVQNELDDGQDVVDLFNSKGMETSGMEDILEDGDDLVDDVDDAYSTYDPKEIRKLHLRHSRLVLLFRLEQMLSVIDYAEPIIQAGDNDNKEEILERADELKEDIGDIKDDCGYSSVVDDNYGYGRENLGCWDDALDAFREFNSLRLLILEGA